MAKDLYKRYIWLVDTIYRAGKITIDEINSKWMRSEMSGGVKIPLRTFHNHRHAIEELFDINIDCDKQNGYNYYIDNAEDMERGGVRSWLLNTFAVNNFINESHKLKHRILFEHIPSGEHFLMPVIEAMKDGVSMEITYQSYRADAPHTFEIEPYCVKIFKKRWYVVARSPYYDRIMIYALDRIRKADLTGNKFKMPDDFDPEAYFVHSFGIITDTDCKPEYVEIKVRDAHKRKYLTALPLHHSQQETEQTDAYSVFRYYLSPTYDFRQELMSHGDEIEVLSPRSLRDEMAAIVKNMCNSYRKHIYTL
jgi:hypothetical protein